MNTSKFTGINEFIAKYPKDIQELLEQVRFTIQKAAPNAEEKISYGIPTFSLNGNLVHFSAFKNHIGFYPGPSGISAFEKELSVYECSKGAVQFRYGKKLPLGLITKIVKYRVKENMEKVKSKS